MTCYPATGRIFIICLWFSIPALFFMISTKAKAGIVKIDITSVKPAYGGKLFGNVGAYEKIKGKAYGEVNPASPQNAKITDIELAPRNGRGMVAYSTDIYILKPVDLTKGNHKLFVEIPNRGSKLFGGLNESSGGNDPATADEAGDAFLLNMGYTIVWCGWDISAAPVNNNMTITVPVAKNKDGSSITGPSYEYISFDNDWTRSYRLAYPSATLVKDEAVLTVRDLLNDVPQPVPASGWEYADAQTIRLLPAGTAFKQSSIYEFTYAAKDPLVAGLGLAATRDFVSFLRHAQTDASGNKNPLAGDVQFTYSFAISQPARYMNDFESLGFNEDEQGRRVIDGIENWLGGGSGVGINYRFAQPGRTERNRVNHLYPEGIFPFAYPPLHDPFSGRTAGRLSGYTNQNNLPKAIEINSANEYWVKAASLLHTDLGGNDLPDPNNVRFYLLSGMQHGSGNGNSRGVSQQFENPTKAEPALRALFIALDEWVTKGVKPPASRIPRRADGTAALAVPNKGSLTGTVPKVTLGWPKIPGVTYNGTITTRYCFDYGPLFKRGIIGKYPNAPYNAPAYQNFVSKVDNDGNEVAGIRLPPVAAPVATLTGWALRREGYGLNDGGEAAGQRIPFKKTKAERLAAGDPRLSLEERYGTHQQYVDAVTKTVKLLQEHRFLLPDDANAYIKEAENSDVLR